MKIIHHNIMQGIMLAAGLAVAITSTHAANRTWNGAGGDNLWSTGANWGGTAPSATGDALFFGGTNRLAPSNTTVTSLAGITFNADAGSFTLSGSTFTLVGNIANNSGVLQTIENAITLSGNRTINTGSGGITLKGGVGETGGARNFFKEGTGTLTLAGANTFTGDLRLYQGTLLLDAASGGSLATGGNIYFGYNVVPTDVNQGGTFEVRGAATGSTTISVDRTLYIGQTSGANQLVVNANGGDGTSLAFASLGRNYSGGYGAPTLNIDLSSPNSALFLSGSNNSQYDYNMFYYATVTDGTKTGFATRDAVTGQVTRYVPTSALPVSGGSFLTTSTYTSGDLTITDTVGTRSITITGAGSLAGSSELRLGTAVLMEEGVGDYTIGTKMVVNAASRGGLIVHQYSTAGTLLITGNLEAYSGYSYLGATFTKAGPGDVRFTGTAATVAGALDVQTGRMILDGSLEAVQAAYVRDGAILSGSGQIGGGTKWIWTDNAPVNDGTRYTPVSVWSGGTLNASHATADALQITGSLTLYSGATYEVNLAGGSFDALSVANITPDDAIVTLDGDLKLTLNYAPTLGETIDLLTSSGGKITGIFATINGTAATPTFLLSGYEFAINYDDNRVWLDTLAIPEPGISILLLAAGALAFLRGRRRF